MSYSDIWQLVCWPEETVGQPTKCGKSPSYKSTCRAPAGVEGDLEIPHVAADLPFQVHEQDHETGTKKTSSEVCQVGGPIAAIRQLEREPGSWELGNIAERGSLVTCSGW